MPNLKTALLAGACLILGMTAYMATAAAATPSYSLQETIPLPGSTRWDCLTFDAAGHRLFITRGDSVDVLDVNAKKIVGTIPNLKGVHSVALAPDLNKGFVTEGKADQVTIFDLKTLKVLATAPTGKKPDVMVYDKTSQRVFVANGESGDMTVIDAKTNAYVSTIILGGQPEFAVVDGAGKLYVNLEDKSQLVLADTKTLNVQGHLDLAPDCSGPTGLAVDAAQHRLFSVCGNKNMVIVDAATGDVIDSLPIGAHSDGAVFDSGTGLAFSSNGDGTLTVVAPNGKDHYAVAQNVQTKLTARTMALDPQTHTIYLAAADIDGMDPATADHEARPRIKPDTFSILVVGTKP